MPGRFASAGGFNRPYRKAGAMRLTQRHKSSPLSHSKGGDVARNLITDVAGLSVGLAEDTALASGVTAIVFEAPAVAAGAGRGGISVNLKGGFGSGSAVTERGHTVGALAAVNAAGSVVVADGPWFWAAPCERAGEFGGTGFPARVPAEALAPRTKASARE